MTVLDDYMVSLDVSFLDKTRIQAQVLVPSPPGAARRTWPRQGPRAGQTHAARLVA
jgi:hypothetical protein